MGRIAKGLALSPFVSQRFVAFFAKKSRDDFHLLGGLLEAEKVTPVIDRTYPLSETFEAIRYLEEGHAQGRVVIMV